MAATQSSFSTRRDGSWDGPGPSVAYGIQQPSSPTLTNPDMILPDYDNGESYDSLSRAPSSSVWSMAHPTNADFSPLPQSNYHAMPLGPSTPIIYGNGTMLSDIGEVTEVESIASSPPRRLTSRPLVSASDGTPLRSSPTIGKVLVNRRPLHERRLSIESTSTINDNGRATALGDFDDSISVADSCFQGDDEESMASSYVEEMPVRQSVTAVRPSIQSINQARPSASSISKRAEHILANAKRRLNTMEGNLSRARNFGYSSASDGPTPSPAARPVKSFDEDMLSKSSSNHARNVSETGLQGTSRPIERFQRSASALGAAGGYRQPLLSPVSADAPGSQHAHLTNKLSHHPLDIVLTPLSEDGDDEGHCASDKFDDVRASSVASPTLSSYSDAGGPRSPSVVQVRDLQDQMEGLKGKISSLRQQARADSMKRRSLQGLRTPSPFTHARWDHAESRSVSNPDQRSRAPESPLSAAVSEGEIGGSPGVPKEDEAQDLPGEDAPSIVGSYHEARETQDQGGSERIEDVETVGESNADVEYLNGAIQDAENDDVDVDGAADTDGWSESGDSLYHDTYQHPVSHEDREDAFDYEHFFLHSAMGTLSQQERSRRGSSGSDESGDSVETTRGPMLSHARRPSLDTFTTVDSFTTATEGRASRSSLMPGGEFGDEDAEVESFALSRASGGGDDEANHWQRSRTRQNSVIHRPNSTTSTLHRPSVSSFESTGTNRSFPLVNRVRMSGGMLTPMGSPGQDLKQVSESLMTETVSICDRESIHEAQPQSPAIQMLSKEDQMMVERVVASLGRCVLGLTESSKTDPGRQEEFRRRIDAARKVLEAGPGS
ncbi:hypothetical protein HRG_005869 [Hirsutella rhossiliensis]|uniref:Uncharacterized protein n=1 Tax=Hirsutella rhossiliensis TaxID=111463 RepID=A0A9P8MZV2_9HYPO|nr:uncharacterized protein HRG_05869 [Hirsutella rhossiliensis]KAH0963359.1 hypothetical protein HRG_05869 [Hirsutella rhossiliensis]